MTESNETEAVVNAILNRSAALSKKVRKHLNRLSDKSHYWSLPSSPMSTGLTDLNPTWPELRDAIIEQLFEMDAKAREQWKNSD